MEYQTFAERYARSRSACFVLYQESGEIRVRYANEKGLELTQCQVIPAPVTVCLNAMPASFFTRLEEAMEQPGVDGWNLFLGESHTELSFCLVPLEEGFRLLTVSCDNVASETLRQMLDSSRKELQNAVARAEEANAAKSRFLSNMSHDIRTPMNAIIGMTDIALSHTDDPAHMIDCLHKVRQASGHLLAIINNVLDMSRIESGRLELHQGCLELGHLLGEIKTIIRPSAQQKGLAFTVTALDIRNELFQGDETRIQQILINFLGNAVKFTPEGGRVSLTVREERVPWQDESTLHFTIADTGVGMDAEFMKKLFTPFERAESAWAQKIEGTGLGMSMARQLTDRMNCSIEVDSTPGVGTTIQVFLPLLPAKPDDTPQAPLYMGQCVLLWDRTGLCVQMEDFLAAQGLFCRTDSDLQSLLSAAAGIEAGNDLWGMITDGSLADPLLAEGAAAVKASLGKEFPLLLLTEEDGSAAPQGVDAVLHWPLFRNDTRRALSDLSRNREPVFRIAGADTASHDYSQRTLLLVEDNDLNMEIAQEFLSETGVQIDTAGNGQEAVDRFAQSAPHEYALILMDIQMPVMDGYEATRRIRAMQRPDAATVGIVAMSANAFAEDVRKSRQCGMNEHLSKPLDTTKLFEILAQWL